MPSRQGNIGRNFSRGGRGSNQGNRSLHDDTDYFMTIKEDMAYAIQQLDSKLDALRTAYRALEASEVTEIEGTGNQGATGHSRSTTRDQGNDGEENTNYSSQDLNNFLQSGARSVVDGSYDLRTMEGRALEGAGWIDQEGFPIKGRGRMFINDSPQVANR